MVHNLNSSNFIISNGKPVLLGNKVYQPSGKKFNQHPLKIVLIMKKTCYHCVNFKPTYEELFNQIGKDFPVLQIESNDISPDLANAFDFTRYPTLKFFDKNGNMVGQYSGDRTKSDILKTICQMYHSSFCPI